MQTLLLPSGTSRQKKMESIMKALEEGIKSVFTSGRYQEYLNVMSRFHHYSSNNVMLILLQRPDATHVAGFHTWKNVFGRSVIKGEVGIRILAPITIKKDIWATQKDNAGLTVLNARGEPVKQLQPIEFQSFRSVSVFDISQTDGKPLPELAKELKATCDQAAAFEKAICEVADCPVEKADVASGANGYYDISRHKIVIRKGMSELQTIKTMVHELAHSRLHSKDIRKAEQKDRATVEVEAESIAYVVLQQFGIDTSDYSFGYLAGWSSGAALQELSSSLSLIQKEANTIISLLHEQLKVTV